MHTDSKDAALLGPETTLELIVTAEKVDRGTSLPDGPLYQIAEEDGARGKISKSLIQPRIIDP
jgi:hypothetical protein